METRIQIQIQLKIQIPRCQDTRILREDRASVWSVFFLSVFGFRFWITALAFVSIVFRNCAMQHARDPSDNAWRMARGQGAGGREARLGSLAVRICISIKATATTQRFA